MASGADNPQRRVPSVDAMLKPLAAAVSRWGHGQVTEQVRGVLAALRTDISNGTQNSVDIADLCGQVEAALEAREVASLRPVLNLTGTVLHTNLGRASLPAQAIDAVATVAATPSNLEFDLDSGQRGKRDSHVEGLICELTGAEAATVVNNNAAAVLLVLNTLAMNREVPVSRGELVEIGGSFRIPEVMQRSNCTLVEVGATNRTHLKDFRQAISERTALLMQVHTSNFHIEGFTSAVDETELAQLAHEHDLPLVVDLGSGSLVDFAALGLPDEPTAAQSIANGVDIITFSGDKLLGGPQSGLIAGRRDLIEQINANPLKRALRLDKMTLAALAEVLKLYRNPQTLLQELPTLRQLTRPLGDIQAQAQRLQSAVAGLIGPLFEVSVADCASQIGSGALPVENIPSAGLRITRRDAQETRLRELSSTLRQLPLPIVGRLHKGSLWLDLRCLSADADLLEALQPLAESAT